MSMSAILNVNQLPLYPVLERYSQWKNLQQYELEFIRHYKVIKVSESKNEVWVALAPDASLKDVSGRLEKFHRNKKVCYYRMKGSDYRAAAARLFARPSDEETSLSEEQKLSLEDLSGDAPTVNLVNSIILDGVGMGASDIHVEKDEQTMSIRYRVDGMLKLAGEYPPERFAALSSRIKLMANLNIMETRKPQDGRLTVSLEGQDMHMRVSIVPLVRGESIVLRLFHREEDLLSTSQLGFPGWTVEAMQNFLQRPYGLLLVTGPTGSGKTTTLNALLAEIKDSYRKIVTIEDPVEYIIPGINQIQVNEALDLSFSNLLRRVLRQDPDVIMVGEIRDEETALLAVRAALTGHPVLASLHTNDAPSAVHRMIDMGVPCYLLASVLRGVLAQRLVRTLCPSCRSMRKADSREQAAAAACAVKLNKAAVSGTCAQCEQTGYIGRTVVSEFFEVNEELQELIAQPQLNINEFRRKLSADGFMSLARQGFEKVEAGITTVEELQRTVLG